MRADIFRRRSLISATSACDSTTRLAIPRSSFNSTEAASCSNELNDQISILTA